MSCAWSKQRFHTLGSVDFAVFAVLCDFARNWLSPSWEYRAPKATSSRAAEKT
jgi:hypothetical protein